LIKWHLFEIFLIFRSLFSVSFLEFLKLKSYYLNTFNNLGAFVGTGVTYIILYQRMSRNNLVLDSDWVNYIVIIYFVCRSRSASYPCSSMKIHQSLTMVKHTWCDSFAHQRKRMLDSYCQLITKAILQKSPKSLSHFDFQFFS